jgi:hypothetical protein
MDASANIVEGHTFKSRLLRAIGDEAAAFFEKTPVYSLPPEVAAPELGVYAIYYVGKCAYYRHISAVNQKACVLPIYVGKAVPSGWRKGRTKIDSSKSVIGRLREHKNSISHAGNLKAKDFRCRFVLLKGIETDLISVLEAGLIRRYHPMWNTVIDGFGNHTPGEGRFNQACSEWDVLHPGRPWAAKCKGVPPAVENILAKIKLHKKSLALP